MGESLVVDRLKISGHAKPSSNVSDLRYSAVTLVILS